MYPSGSQRRMVSDSELVSRLREVLRTADLNTTTASSARSTLEEEFGVDLSDRKALIRDQIGLFLESGIHGRTDNDDVDDNEEEADRVEFEEDNHSGAEEDVAEDEEEDEDSNEKKIVKGRPDKKDNAVKKRGRGFNKPCSLSPQLQKITGATELARSEKLWAYIRAKNSQDPKNRKKILCDEALLALFRVKSINMFQMIKVLSKHIWPLNKEDVPVGLSQKEKQRKQGREDEGKVKRQKTKGSGFLAPVPLSDALVKFFGEGENTSSRADVVKRMWDYIKQHDLQDPSHKGRIICDKKLKELFKVDSFQGFTISKLLTAHFIRAK